MEVILTLIGLSVVVFVHELGHLYFAKRGGIGVLEFSLGMGPLLFKKQFRDTVYSLRLFPLGGYVKMAGLDSNSDSEQIDSSTFFQNRPLIARMLTIVAGSLMNLVFAFVIFFLLFYFLGIASVSNKVAEVKEGSPAFYSGIQVGDQIQTINGRAVNDAQRDIIAVVQNNPDELSIELKRKDQIVSVVSKAFFDKEFQVYRLGIVLQNKSEKFLFLNSITKASLTFIETSRFVFFSFKQLVMGRVNIKEMSGPIGLVQVASHQLSTGFSSFFALLAFISLSLAYFNLLPIPVLDGGHLLFLIYEAVIGKPVPKKVHTVLNNFFAFLLIALMIFVLYNDIVSWSARENLINNLMK
jgi:regulator of sigma E protease